MTRTIRRLWQIAAVIALSGGACTDAQSLTGLTDELTDVPAGMFGIVVQSAPSADSSPVPTAGGPALASVSLDKVVSITLEIGRVDAKRADGGWVDAGVVNASLDLLNLPDEGFELLDSSLPTGEYQMLRLFLTADPTITLNTDVRVGRTTYEAGEHPLSIPSAEQNGLRLHAEFTVDAGGEILTIVVDGGATVRKVTATGSGVLKISPELQVRGEDGKKIGELESEDENEDGEELDEVEGLVMSVGDGSFTLLDETVVRVDDHTEIDGDLFTLEAVSEALAAEEAVRAEAKGTLLDDGSMRAVKVEFETDGEDPEGDDDDEVEVKGHVTSVHPDEDTFTLVKGDHQVTVAVDDYTELEGDFESLVAVAEALLSDHVIHAEADEVPPVAVPLPMLDPEPSVVPGVGAS